MAAAAVAAATAAAATRLPLAGLRVVEFAGLAPVPLVGKMLGDFGAAVTRIDRLAAPLPDVLGGGPAGKRSIALDVRKPAGAAVVRRLVTTADILLDPFRPGVLESMGCAPATLATWNSRLIVARLTGYGGAAYGTPGGAPAVAAGAGGGKAPRLPAGSSDYRAAAGHDINYVAMSGLLSAMARPGGQPSPPLNLLGDFGGGSAMALIGILLALHARERSGVGCVIDASMTAGTAYLGTLIYNLMAGGLWSATPFLQPGGAPYYETYATADGRWVAVGAIEPQFWDVCVAGLTAVAREAGFEDAVAALAEVGQHDSEGWPRLRHAMARVFAARPLAAWEAHFGPGSAYSEACVTPVLTPAEGAAFVARQAGSTATPSLLLPPAAPVPPFPPRAPRLSPLTPAAGDTLAAPHPRHPAVLLERGAHTRAILREAGYSDAEIRALEEARIVAQADEAPAAPPSTAARL